MYIRICVYPYPFIGPQRDRIRVPVWFTNTLNPKSLRLFVLYLGQSLVSSPSQQVVTAINWVARYATHFAYSNNVLFGHNET